MKETGSSKASVNLKQTARRHILEYTIFLACMPTFCHCSVQDNFWIIHILMMQQVFSTKISIDTYHTAPETTGILLKVNVFEGLYSPVFFVESKG
jgi:hypothetical protein